MHPLLNLTFCPTEINEKLQAITIQQRIDSFEGFDAYGFFTLGRPHLTSVVTNFITFFIVLIQFKIYFSFTHWKPSRGFYILW